jgi:hypothetical protein
MSGPLPAKGILVWLDAGEMGQCDRAAAARWRYARSTGIQNKRVDKSRTDSDVDLLGIRAEVAVAKLLGINYDHLLTPSVDDGTDLMFKGISIDVKSTFHETGRLILRRELRAEVAVLVVPTAEVNVMRVVGYTTPDHFKRCKSIEAMGGRQVECLRQDALLTVDALWSMGMDRAGVSPRH